MGKFLFKVGDTDITNIVENAEITGDIEQAARMCEFTIAFNPKDEFMPNPDIQLGNIIYVYYQEDVAAEDDGKSSGTSETDDGEIFRGVIFFRERDTSNTTMRFTAYDFLIYLAKSKTTRTFKNITVENVVAQVCNELGVLVGEIAQTGVIVDFIADSKTGIEIIREALEFARAQTGKRYTALMRREKLCVIERGQLVEAYTATDKTNIERTAYSESIEDMVNQVMIVDKDGNTAGYVINEEDRKAYGMLQDIYKIDDKKDTQSHARAALKSVARACSLSGVGDIRCMTGFAIEIQDEQLKGKFFVKSDRHSIRNAAHTMELELEFMEMTGDEQ